MRVVILCGMLLAPLASNAAGRVSSAQTENSATSDADEKAKVEFAVRLVDQVNPDERLLAQELHGWEVGVRQLMSADPSISKLEQEFPGIIEAGLASAKPIARDYLAGPIAKLKRFKAESIASKMTLAELQEVQTFFNTPAGRRISSGMTEPQHAEVLVNRVASRVEETGKIEITDQDATLATRQAVRNVMGGASSQEVLAVMKFESSPVGIKLGTAAEEAQKYALELANSPDPAFLERQSRALTDGMVAFSESAKKG